MSKKDKKLLKRIIASLILFVLGLMLPSENIAFFVYIASYLMVGYEIIKKAVLRILKMKFLDENFLMATASIGAFVIGEYTEAVAVIIFYQIGELFQSYSVGKSRRSIKELMSISPDYAFVEENGAVLKKLPDEVKVGDILIIKPGEKVPVDGVIFKGKTAFNTAPLTGESIPRNAEEGDRVSSGFINIDGMIKIRAEKEYSDSTVAKILELVENSTMAKAKTERFITRFSAYYTPVVVGLAVCLAFVPPLFFGGFSEWIYRALSFLVVSCPCALVISVPLSFFGGIGGASKKGILVKGANYLEMLAKCEVFAFDKTGTLTKGKFEIVSVNPVGMSQEEFLSYLVSAEKGSNHPIAQAVVSCFGNNEAEAEITEIAGRGVRAELNGKTILSGNFKLMQEYGIECGIPIEYGTALYMAVDGIYAGYVIVADSLKEESERALKELLATGIDKTVMLTGDTMENAEFALKQICVSEYRAELLPEDKVDAVKEIAENGKCVAFVGDGINDAPVLALADVGIAMGGIGSDASIEAADIVIMDDNLLKLPVAVKIAKKTMRIVGQNIVFAIGVKVMVLILSAFGVTNMWAAVFADVGVAVTAILNAMRTMRIKE